MNELEVIMKKEREKRKAIFLKKMIML